MVDRLLALKARLEAVLAASFGGAAAFGATLRDALSYSLNTRWVAGVFGESTRGGLRAWEFGQGWASMFGRRHGGLCPLCSQIRACLSAKAASRSSPCPPPLPVLPPQCPATQLPVCCLRPLESHTLRPSPPVSVPLLASYGGPRCHPRHSTLAVASHHPPPLHPPPCVSSAARTSRRSWWQSSSTRG